MENLIIIKYFYLKKLNFKIYYYDKFGKFCFRNLTF
jgi:hypothetical protein